MERQKTTYMQVDLGALQENVQKIKRAIGPSVGVIGVAKCDGYGLGIGPITRTLFSARCEKVAISTLQEVETVRKENIHKPLVTLYPPLPWELESLVSSNTEITIDSIEDAESIAVISRDKGVQIKVHLMIDTGMHRYGIEPRDAVSFIKKILDMDNLELEGLCTHFATATRSDKFAVGQFETFMYVVKSLAEHRLSVPTIHVANSAAIIGYPDTVNPRTFTPFMPHAKLCIRPGGMLYGLYGDINKNPNLQMGYVLKRVVSHISSIAEVEAGDSIGYGRRWIAQEKTKIATIPVGFGDNGYLIRATECTPLDKEPTQVLIHGKRCNILGLVASSGFGVNLGKMKAGRGDEVVLLGEQGGEQITIEEIADRNSLISMQLQTILGARMEKMYES